MPSASTSQETCGSPRPSTAGSAVIVNGPTSACSQVATARRSRAGTLELRVRLGEREVLGVLSSRPDWLVDRGVGRERRGQRAGVGVVAVQVADEARDGGPRGLGRDHRRQLDSAQDVSPSAAKVAPGSASGSITSVCPVGLELHSCPAQPAHLHPFLALLVYRTIVRYIIAACPAAPQPPSPRPAPRSPGPRSTAPRSRARGPDDRRPGRRGGDAKEQRLQPVRQQGGAAARDARGGGRAVQARGLGAGRRTRSPACPACSRSATAGSPTTGAR